MASLGPEVALSHNHDSGPAPFTQYVPTLATDGSEFLLSWEHWDDINSPHFESHLDSLGQPLEPFARRLDHDRWYASTGHGDYLVTWWDDRYFWVQRVDAAGEPAGPPNPVLGHGPYYSGIHSLVANRDCYLLTVIAGDSPIYETILLDRIGRVIQRRDLGPLSFSKAVPYEGGFIISGRGFYGAQLSTLSNSGTLTRLDVPDLPRTPPYALRASGDRLMIAWYEKRGFARLMILGLHGFVLKWPFSVPLPGDALPDDLLWDGNEFLLLARDYLGKLWAIRLDGSGNRLDDPYLLTENAHSPAVFAANETARLLVWSDTRFSSEADLVGLRFQHFSELADARDQAVLMSRSATAQSAVQIASSGSHLMAVWTNEPSHTISGSIDGTEVDVTSAARRDVDLAAVAGSPDGFLVAWNEYAAFDEGSLFVRRYALDGTPLDEQPVAIFEHVPSSLLHFERDSWVSSTVNYRPALLYDGTSFVVFEGDAYTLRIARIDPRTGAVTKSSAPLSTRTFGLIRPVATAAGWYVPYTRRAYGIPLYDPALGISVATIGRDGAVRDFETPYYCSDEQAATFSTASAQDTVTQLITWHGISLWRSTQAGESLGKPVDISDRGNVVSSDIVWNGSEYVAAWIVNTGIVRVRRFAADGQPLDPEPFTIATDAEPIGPSIAVTPSGVAIAYSKRDDAYGGVPRARMRTLERLTR